MLNKVCVKQGLDTCGFTKRQVIAIANNSGEASGGTLGSSFSVVGSGTPSTCDIATCTGAACPFSGPPFNCSWDYSIKNTVLHETGHTLTGLKHTCYPDITGVIKDPALAAPTCSGNVCLYV